MPDSETNPDSKPWVSSEAINTAYKLEAFIESGYRYSLALSKELIDTISYITNEYEDPSPTRDHLTAACNGQKTRQGRSLGIKPLHVRATVRRYNHMTYDVRQVQHMTYNSITWSHLLSKQLVSK